MVGTWHGTCIIWKQVFWVHCDDMEFFMSIIMFSPHDLYDGGVRRQQELLLLWLLLGEYGLNFSHTLHDILGERDGTIKVQRGYPSTFEDQEVLPHRKETPTHSSMMVDDFGMWHVKEWSHGVEKALSLRPTAMSLGSMFLSMECSKGSMQAFILQTFMRRFSWEGSSMDLTFSLITMRGVGLRGPDPGSKV